ncbi:MULTISPECIES: redoxin domain-containing protein [Actinomycetes]|uniref:Redoxin domain-containing protein n=4 Tax=Pseudonocardiaceae TaxID=2070 RepID=A0A8E1W6N0_9PSEU|nr:MULTISPECIES: redoxin domain-containing protein [Actinomycetes]PXY18127.1 redoxin [Prauserella coralliicola]AXB46076.1 redoxin [Amycolatopsis albispora]MBB2505046.1 redoxin domain-containing protein [Amycolatopsis echigonensis]MBF6188740.1 redoxin domain-containing protein [Nocardia farcinica]MBF6295596.1 redoxin domain-containing protein [Nocardia farcinica]
MIPARGWDRLHELEQRFADLGDRLDADSPVTEALSVLHAITQEIVQHVPVTGETQAVGHQAPDGITTQGVTLEDVANLHRSAPPMQGARESTGLAVGTRAPDFTLPDAKNRPVSLADFRGHPVLLVFYPLDWSHGCSRQLELYQQELPEFASRGVTVLGISADSLYSHGAWAAVRGITFPLLADFHPKGEVARRYQVWRESDGFSERALYLVDADGVIRYAHVSPQVDHIPDIYELFDALDQVAQQPASREPHDLTNL